MTAVALLFSIYMIKPSPFCLLDELDAALDDSNIGRFVGVLQDFLNQSQYVVITHNRQTIAAVGGVIRLGQREGLAGRELDRVRSAVQVGVVDVGDPGPVRQEVMQRGPIGSWQLW